MKKFKKFLFLPILIAITVFVWVVNRQELTVIPHPRYPGNIGSFTDSIEGGGSRVYSLKTFDEFIMMEYSLDSKIEYPFAGFYLSFPPEDQLNIGAYDYVTVTLEASRFKKFNINLYSDENDMFSFALPEGNKLNYSVPLKEFRPPIWWLRFNGYDMEGMMAKGIRKVSSIQIGTYHFETGFKDTVILRKLVFKKNDTPFYFLLFGVILIYFLVLLLLRPEKKPESQELPYSPLQISNWAEENLEKIHMYIKQHYADPELTGEKICNTLGLSKDKFNLLIKENFQMSFKQLLNQVRIKEAARLLEESDRQATEIAFQVGYNNYAHFFKIFRSIMGSSPGDYRRSKMQT